MTHHGEKFCAVCGRRIEWRRKWARDWDCVRYCSRRGRGKSICPSEAARAVGGKDWKRSMEPARAAARRLAAGGRVEITQGGRVVDGSTARGPVRIRLGGRKTD
jgi:hypothetical protein